MRSTSDSVAMRRGCGRSNCSVRSASPIRPAECGRTPTSCPAGSGNGLRSPLRLSCDPDVLIADEPTTHSMSPSRRSCSTCSTAFAGATARRVADHHDLGVVAGRADDVAVMYAGRIVEQGHTATVFRDPQHPYTAALLGAVPRLEHRSHHRLAAIPGVPPILLGRPPGCGPPRCSRAGPRCSSDDPQLMPSSADSSVACWYPTGLTLVAPR